MHKLCAKFAIDYFLQETFHPALLLLLIIMEIPVWKAALSASIILEVQHWNGSPKPPTNHVWGRNLAFRGVIQASPVPQDFAPLVEEVVLLQDVREKGLRNQKQLRIVWIDHDENWFILFVLLVYLFWVPDGLYHGSKKWWWIKIIIIFIIS